MQESLPLPTSIPQNIYQLAERYKLGQPLSSHRRICLYTRFVGIVVWCGLAIWVVTQSIQIRNIDVQIYALDRVQAAQNVANCQNCGAVQQAQIKQNNFYMLASDEKNLSLDKYGIGAAVGEAAIPFLLLLMVYVESKLRLYVCSDGLLSMKGKQATALHWDEISEISWLYGFIRQISQGKNGKSKILHIWAMSNAWKVCRIVDEQVMSRLLTGARMQYAWNGVADFGSVYVNRDGVGRTSQRHAGAKERELVAWENLEDIRFVRGAISLKIGGKWKRWTAGFWAQLIEHRPVLNPTVCVALVKEIRELGAWNKI